MMVGGESFNLICSTFHIMTIKLVRSIGIEFVS